MVKQQQRRQYKKKKKGRPPKPHDEQTVKHLNVGFNASLSEALDVGCEKLRRETGGLCEVNPQLIINILVRQFARDLERKEFSILSEYLETKNGESPPT